MTNPTFTTGLNLPLTRNWGSALLTENPDLIRNLDEMYSKISLALQSVIKKDVVSGADPSANSQRNTLFSVGDITVRTDTDTAWIMTSRTDPENVVWTQIS
jgi:hypothetical protein